MNPDTLVAQMIGFPDYFTLDQLSVGLYDSRTNDSDLFTLAENSFNLLHGNESPPLGAVISLRMVLDHYRARDKMSKHPFYGCRLFYHRGILVGGYCVGIDGLQVPEPRIDGFVGDFLLLATVIPGRGLPELMFADLNSRAKEWASDAGEPRCLALSVDRTSINSTLLKNLGFIKFPGGRVQTKNYGNTDLYTQVYRPAEDH